MQPQINIVRRPEVLKRLGISNTCLHSRINKGLLPPSIPLGVRSVGWLEHELDQVLAAMVAGKSEEHIKALVGHLIDQRKNAA
jgi:prophage regulatory protein